MHSLRSALCAAGLIAAVASPARLIAQATPAPAQAQKQDAEDRAERGGRRERHPAIRAAIRSLERAKFDLNHASHDFGGHRADALKAVDEAIAQLRQALQYDKK